MEIKRENNPSHNGGYIYYLIDENKKLKIIYSGNGDLYISLYNKGIKYRKSEDKEDFLITKENYAIYTLFEELYERITTGKIFDDEAEMYDIPKNYPIFEKMQEVYNSGLINPEGEIEWFCDDYPIGIGDSLKIIKEDDQYRLLFTRHNSEQIENYNCLSIRISNSGSRYMPFNSCFMNFYNKLQNIDPNNYQQHIEEFIYKQKVKK